LTDNPEILDEISGIKIEREICARKITSYAVGGNINILITVKDSNGIPHVLRALRKADISYLILGAGTNMLVSDDGFKGAFVRLNAEFREIHNVSEQTIYAGGACLISDLILFLRRNNLGGPLFLSGIPGTIGGAVAMNAGAFGGEISEYLTYIDVVTSDGEILKLKPSECEFGYRQSKIKKEKLFVTGVEIAVTPGKKIENEVEEYLTRRSKNHLQGSNYAGSVFKNPKGNYAGKLIDDCGLKGLRVGSAFVSEKHANFIISDDGGSASDVFDLMKISATRVFHFYGIKLEPEIQLVGFDIKWDEIFKL